MILFIFTSFSCNFSMLNVWNGKMACKLFHWMAIRHTSAIKPLFCGHLNIYLNGIFQRFFMTLFCLGKKRKIRKKNRWLGNSNEFNVGFLMRWSINGIPKISEKSQIPNSHLIFDMIFILSFFSLGFSWTLNRHRKNIIQ